MFKPRTVVNREAAFSVLQSRQLFLAPLWSRGKISQYSPFLKKSLLENVADGWPPKEPIAVLRV